MPTVSVLLPCYNAAETLEEALLSLEKQTLTDFEVIVVNDGSEDRTREIFGEKAKEDSRFRLLSTPHRGIVHALNLGFQACRATYIARMDADDRAHPERLAKQVAYLDENPETALVSCLVKGFPSENLREGFRIYLDWLNGLVTHEKICREIFVESPLPHPSVVFRKEWLEKVGGYQEHGWPEDYDLWLRMYAAGARFAKIPEMLLEWREHPDRLTRIDSRYSLENFIRCKAHYLLHGPIVGRDGILIWGAGMVGRRFSKYLVWEDAPLAGFIDIDPRKIGRTRRGRPIIPPEDLPAWWQRYQNPVLFAAVGARKARPLIRERLSKFGLREGKDWWAVA